MGRMHALDISAVASEMAEQGISKDRENRQQGFNFRGTGFDGQHWSPEPVILDLSSVLQRSFWKYPDGPQHRPDHPQQTQAAVLLQVC